MESSLTALGLLQHCRFTGAVQAHEVPGLLAQMDIATAPYPAQDNFYFSPLKIYEYLAAELPVVTTRVGHLATVVLQDVDGLLVPPGDPDAFADALATLVQDPALRLSMGRPGNAPAQGRARRSAVLMSSGQILRPMAEEIAYITSKAALVGATSSLADGLADRGIRLNTVNPGPVNTGYMDAELEQALAPTFPHGLTPSFCNFL